MSRKRPSRHIDPITGKLTARGTENIAIAPPPPRIIDVPAGVRVFLQADPQAVRLCLPAPDGSILRFAFDQAGAEKFGIGFIHAALNHANIKAQVEAELKMPAAELDQAGANDDLLAQAAANVARPTVVVPGATLEERWAKASQLYADYAVPIDPALQAEWDADRQTLAPDAGPDHPAIRPGREDAA